MPYGRKFLEAIDSILYETGGNDAHATSDRIMQQCTKCDKKMSGTPEMFDLKLSGVCKACVNATLVGYNEDKSFRMVDIFSDVDQNSRTPE